MRVRSLPKAPGLMALAAFFLALGMLSAFTPTAVDWALLGIGTLFGLAAAVYADRRLRAWRVLAPAFVLIIAVDAALVGNYLPYELEIGDLSEAKYGSDDMPGKTALFVSLFILSGMAAVVGLAVGLLASVVLWSLSRLRHAAAHLRRERQGAGLQRDH